MYFMCVPPSVNRTGSGRIDTSVRKYLPSSMPSDAAAAVDALYRSDWGRIVATLIRLVGDFEAAEESAQEAFTAAVDQWRGGGVRVCPPARGILPPPAKRIDPPPPPPPAAATRWAPPPA